MGRKPRNVKPKRKPGRPPGPPRTELARWLRTREIPIAAFADTLAMVAPRVGLRAVDAPQRKTLQDAINGRHWPSGPTMLLVRHATNGAIDLEHWVRDLGG